MTAFFSWYLLITILGWLTVPLACRLFTALPDRGYTLARAAGLLVWGYVFWLLASFGFIHNDTAGLVLALLPTGAVERLELLTLDARYALGFGRRPPGDDIVIAWIDQESMDYLDRNGTPFPWPREVYAQVLAHLTEAGAPQVLAPFWDDLELGTGGVLYLVDGESFPRRLVIQWNKVRTLVDPASELSFQVQLYENGAFRFVYKSLAGSDAQGESATLGVNHGPQHFTAQQSFNAGVPVLTPAPYVAYGLEETAGPAANALVIFDNGDGWGIQPGNTPPEGTEDPHSLTRKQPTAWRQMATFYDTGEIVHTCGDTACLCNQGACD